MRDAGKPHKCFKCHSVNRISEAGTPHRTYCVVDVYGVKLYIAKEDLAGPRTQIPVRNRFGIKLSDTRRGQRMIRRGDGTTIHRDNITGQANAHFMAYHDWKARGGASE